MTPPLLLLDIDGTLIEDRGYRHAQVAAARWVCRRHGWPDHTPTDHEINVLHACGFSNEWDSTPFNVGINLVEAGRNNGARPDFAAWAMKTRGVAGPPIERARSVLLDAAPPALHATIHRLFDDVKDPRVSETTRALYWFVLGSRRFEAHFGFAAEVETPSFLETMDVPIPDRHSRALILSHSACAFTARPSLPPEGQAGLYQTPEGEIALAQLDMTGLPLMGLGPMQWLAEVQGGSIWDYAKPAPTQPIAAMLAAMGASLKDAALAAHRFVTAGGASEAIRSLHGAQVIVFEDNAGGVRACREAAALLARAGIRLGVTGCGVARDEAKRAALAEVCDAVFDDVNAALRALPL